MAKPRSLGYDGDTLDLGELNPPNNFRLGHTSVSICRCVEEHADVPDREVGWQHANLEITSDSIGVSLSGLNPQDLRRLAIFLTDYAGRMERF